MDNQPRQPGELIFAFVRVSDGARITCELRDHGKYGIEAQFVSRGVLLYGRIWPSRDLAIGWAEEERTAIEKGGVS